MAQWIFPETHGGQEYGPNDAAFEHFRDDASAKFVREMVQNSLDAHDPGYGKGVCIKIKELDISGHEIGATQLRSHMQACIGELEKTGSQDKHVRFYTEAERSLAQDTIRTLAVIDQYTTGLKGEHWDTLVHRQGSTHKGSKANPSGTFGIGKNAAFNLSALNTVFYTTRYVESRRGVVAKLAGKAHLITHSCPPPPLRKKSLVQTPAACRLP